MIRKLLNLFRKSAKVESPQSSESLDETVRLAKCAGIIEQIETLDGTPKWHAVQIVSDDGEVWFDGERQTEAGLRHIAEIETMRRQRQSI